jgi:hypothetical protein
VRHRYVGNVGTPDLVWVGEGKIAEQVGIDRVGSIVSTGVGCGIDDMYTHECHEMSDSMSADHVAISLKHAIQFTSSEERIVSMETIKGFHKSERIRRYDRDGVETGTSNAKKLGLTSESERGVILINQDHSGSMGRSHQVEHIFF